MITPGDIAVSRSDSSRAPRLTIAIPTYNRAIRVRERLLELLPQLTDQVELIVFDNGSTDETPALFSGEFADAQARYHRWPANRGMMRNFIRCFEETEGAWLWILGDDDPVRPDAVALALGLIGRSHAGTILTTTNCNFNREAGVCEDLDALFAIKDVPSLCHVSALLYRRAAIAPHFGCLAPASFTVANIAVIILRMLDAGTASLQLAPETLLIDRINPRRWSVHEVALGFSLIPEFLSQRRHRRMAALGVWHGTRWMLMWELMEVIDGKGAQRWKNLCRKVDAILWASGATFLAGCLTHSRSLENLRRALLLKVFAFLPTPLLRLFGQRLRRRTGGREGEAHMEFATSTRYTAK